MLGWLLLLCAVNFAVGYVIGSIAEIRRIRHSLSGPIPHPQSSP
jgi:hypothetical protein